MKINKKESLKIAKIIASISNNCDTVPAVRNWGCSAVCGGLGEYLCGDDVKAVVP